MRCLALSAVVLSLSASVPASAAEPLAGTCRPARGIRPESPIEVRIVGNLGDLVELYEYVGGNPDRPRLLFADYNGMRGSMGGARGKLDCDDISFQGNVLVAVRAGHMNDLVHAYGIIRDASGNAVGVQRAIVRFRDGANIGVYVDGNDVLVQFGREKDLRTRLCFGNRPGADNPPYTATEWGWFYSTPRTGNFPACQGRLNPGASGNANWGQDHFAVGRGD